MDEVILVDAKDNEIGTLDKIKAHLGSGILHRAFTIFVFNRKGETLLTKRAGGKMLWPGFWDSACASHPRKGESYEESGEKRLREELGFSCKLKLTGKFQYKVGYDEKGSENELCAILLGNYDGNVKPNAEEVAEWEWISVPKLKKEIKEKENIYAPWLKLALDRLVKEGRI